MIDEFSYKDKNKLNQKIQCFLDYHADVSMRIVTNRLSDCASF